MKNIYVVSQGVNNGYDTYLSAVVTAESEDQARLIHPSGSYEWNGENWTRLIGTHVSTDGTWAPLEDVIVQLVGTTIDDNVDTVICADFHGG